MDFENEFYEQLKTELESRGDYTISMDSVHKVGGEVDCIRIQKEGDYHAMIIYPEEYQGVASDHEELNSLVSSLSDNIVSRSEQIPELPGNPENLRENLTCQLINAEQNQELLSRCPHDLMEDIAVIARCTVDNGSNTGSFIVTNDHLAMFGMTGNELIEKACQNTETQEYSVRSMKEVMHDILSEDGLADDMIDGMLGQPELPMYVITNSDSQYGAAAMLSPDVMEQVSEKVGEPFYLLPSSTHEVLAVPQSMGDPKDLAEMVKEVNATQVDLCDQLSNNIYQFNELTQKISIVKTEEKAVEATETIAKAVGKGKGR